MFAAASRAQHNIKWQRCMQHRVVDASLSRISSVLYPESMAYLHAWCERSHESYMLKVAPSGLAWFTHKAIYQGRASSPKRGPHRRFLHRMHIGPPLKGSASQGTLGSPAYLPYKLVSQFINSF